MYGSILVMRTDTLIVHNEGEKMDLLIRIAMTVGIIIMVGIIYKYKLNSQHIKEL